MAAVEMYDYLSTVSPDKSDTLSILPHEVLTERGTKNQVVHRGDDGSDVVISLGSSFIFYVTLIWLNLSASDAGTILDLYYDSAKANRSANTFKWTHPSDGHTYVVRFLGDIQREIRPAGWHSVMQVTLQVVGRIADA